mmetsp:Transcript_48030/g.114144  ORF Transcript_48030/g.114144 Transcript_48030/m.114144 type:complete len:302 (-) Transcript_48030:125-1030(-)
MMVMVLSIISILHGDFVATRRALTLSTLHLLRAMVPMGALVAHMVEHLQDACTIWRRVLRYVGVRCTNAFFQVAMPGPAVSAVPHMLMHATAVGSVLGNLPNLKQRRTLHEGSEDHSIICDAATVPLLPCTLGVFLALLMWFRGASILNKHVLYQRVIAKLCRHEISQELLFVDAATIILCHPFARLLLLALLLAQIEARLELQRRLLQLDAGPALQFDLLLQVVLIIAFGGLIRTAHALHVCVFAKLQTIGLRQVFEKLQSAQTAAFILRFGASTHVFIEPVPTVVGLALRFYSANKARR